MNISNRAQRVWDRLHQELGDLFVSQVPVMPPRWAQVVDSLNDNAVKAGLARLKDMRRVPTTADFEEAMGSVPRQAAPNRMSELVAYVVKHHPMTPAQICSPWTWLHTGSARSGDSGFSYTGVRVPPDHKTGKPGFTVDFGVLG